MEVNMVPTVVKRADEDQIMNDKFVETKVECIDKAADNHVFKISKITIQCRRQFLNN